MGETYGERLVEVVAPEVVRRCLGRGGRGRGRRVGERWGERGRVRAAHAGQPRDHLVGRRAYGALG